MLTTEKELELTRLYFNGKLKEKELQEYERKLQTDEEFRRRIFVERMVFEAAAELFEVDSPSAKGLQEARALADELEEELFGVGEGAWEDLEVDIDVTPTYTLQELLAYFKPIEHFESANRRSSFEPKKTGLDALVLSPENEIDCLDYTLDFTLKEAVPFELELTILDNQEDILKTQIIAAQTFTFSVSLTFLQSKVGKFYWRLKANTRDRAIRKEYKSVVRSFFLNKQMNPYS